MMRGVYARTIPMRVRRTLNVFLHKYFISDTEMLNVQALLLTFVQLQGRYY